MSKKKKINVKLDDYIMVIYKNVLVLGSRLKYIGIIMISPTYFQMVERDRDRYINREGGGERERQNVSW